MSDQIPVPEFEPWPKIHRLNRPILVTEKIDGSNAQIYVGEDGQVFAGSRTRWIFPMKGQDNFGFAEYVRQNADAFRTLGPGRHYGEWFGAGIQRGYGMTDRKLAFFNPDVDLTKLPANCCVVPTLYQGQFNQQAINDCLESLKENGSMLVPGFMDPEGLVVFHYQGRVGFKITCKGDAEHKGVQRAE